MSEKELPTSTEEVDTHLESGIQVVSIIDDLDEKDKEKIDKERERLDEEENEEEIEDIGTFDLDEIMEKQAQGIDAVTQFLLTQREATIGIMKSETEEQEESPEINLDNALKIMRTNRTGEVRQAYFILSALLNDEEQDWKERIKPINYLIMINDKEFLDDCDENLNQMLDDEKLESREKYTYLNDFVKSHIFPLTRIRTMEWGEKVSRDLMWKFFLDGKNESYYRILSSQFLLGKSVGLEPKRRHIINQTLGHWAKDETREDNQRADIADIILKYGDEKRKLIGKKVLKALGTKEGGYTIYDNAQNVHSEQISNQIMEFLEHDLAKDKIKMVRYNVINDDGEEVTFKRIETFNDTIEELRDMIKEYQIILSDAERDKFERGIERIKLDSASYTNRNMLVGEILQRVWNRIKRKNDKTRNELTTRLVTEILDSEGTCSSGFVERIATVFVKIQIEYRDQIIANIKGRLNALVRELDEDAQGEITNAMIGTGEEREPLNKFVEKQKEELKKEMYDEFVGGSYVDGLEFDKYFQEGIELYMKGN